MRAAATLIGHHCLVALGGGGRCDAGSTSDCVRLILLAFFSYFLFAKEGNVQISLEIHLVNHDKKNCYSLLLAFA